MAPKRSLGESASAPKAKKHKPHTENNKPAPSTSNLLASEIDFPRGGGTSFTPLEVKNIRAEAVKEADDELFEVCSQWF
jgi:rRNA biogenesis protein RRP5